MHSKGQPAAAPGASPSITRRDHRRRSSECTKNATAVVGEKRPAQVTKSAPSNKIRMRRRYRTKSLGGSQDATAVGGKEGTAEATKIAPADKTQMRRRHRFYSLLRHVCWLLPHVCC
jgi:hypothetical protein